MIRAVMLIECLCICRGMAPSEENGRNLRRFEIINMVNNISGCRLGGQTILAGEE